MRSFAKYPTLTFSFLVLCATYAVTLGNPQQLTAENWPRFRGPNGSGLSTAKNIPHTWSEEDYLWQIDLPGVGHSSPVIWNGKLFVTSGDEESAERIITCVRAADGKELWTKRYAGDSHRKHKHNSFASATPAVDAQRLYVTFAAPTEYLVLALSHEGEELWRTDLGSFNAGHGAGVSPIVFENLLIVPQEQNGPGAVVALDTSTGKTQWSTPRDDKASYSTPCIFHPTGSAPQLILTNWTSGITGLNPRTGKQLWTSDIFDKSHVESAIGSPIVVGNLVLGVCGWLGHGNEVVAVRPPNITSTAAAPTTAPEKIYHIDRSAPLCTTPIAKDGLLFTWTDAGIAACSDAVTGETHWIKRIGGNYYSSPIIIGDALYNISTSGEVVVLSATTDYQQLGKSSLPEGTHSTPAVADGVMYIRTFTKLFAVGGE